MNALVAAAFVFAHPAPEIKQVEVSVAIMQKLSELPVALTPNVVKTDQGTVSNLGTEDIDRFGIKLNDLKLAEDIAQPRVVVPLGGASGTVLSVIDDGTDPKGVGYEVRVTALKDGYTVELDLGEPKGEGIHRIANFKLGLKKGELILINPSKTLCGERVVALVQVKPVQNEVDVIL